MNKQIVAVVYDTGEVEVTAPTSIGVLLAGSERLRHAVQQMTVYPPTPPEPEQEQEPDEE
jgi:hypothetical protein